MPNIPQKTILPLLLATAFTVGACGMTQVTPSNDLPRGVTTRSEP